MSYRGGMPSMMYVLEPGGLVAGGVPNVFADSDADTLKRMLPTGGSTFPPLTAAVQRNYVEPDRAYDDRTRMPPTSSRSPATARAAST